jgi:hypothetical protein
MNFSTQDYSNGIILVMKMLFSVQALLKSKGTYVNTQNYPERIIDIWPESIVRSSHLAHGRGK